MKSFIAASAALLSLASAHSWVECANHDNSQMVGWMLGNSTLNPPVIIDPAQSWYSYLCKGWPRNKANPGNWIEESTDYTWNLAANSFMSPPDTHACNPNQRSPTYQNGAPMTTASPGDMIRLRYGGNGHTRGYNAGFAKGPGTVAVYWKGSPEQEITDVSEFTTANLVQTTGFADLAFAYPADKSITTPDQGLVDKGNWMELNLPKTMTPGRHMMVWVWSFDAGMYGRNGAQWSTCFDVMISGDAKSPVASSPAAVAPPVAASPYVAPVAASTYVALAAPAKASYTPKVDVAAVAAPAPTQAPSPIIDEVYTTTTVIEWTTETVYPNNDKVDWKRAHPRAF